MRRPLFASVRKRHDSESYHLLKVIDLMESVLLKYQNPNTSVRKSGALAAEALWLAHDISDEFERKRANGAIKEPQKSLWTRWFDLFHRETSKDKGSQDETVYEPFKR